MSRPKYGGCALNRLRKDVRNFYRVRVTLEDEYGKTTEFIHGPYTTRRKAREIKTRLEHWKGLLRKTTYGRRFSKVTYDIEETPVIGWYSVSRNEYVNP